MRIILFHAQHREKGFGECHETNRWFNIDLLNPQFVDFNGNGLFYNFKNTVINQLTNKKEKVKMSYFIFPEIPLIDFTFTNPEDTINLFDTEEYTFSFSVLNIGCCDINKAKLQVYAYKKDDYKVSIGEMEIKNSEETCLIPINRRIVFTYFYHHFKKYKSLEFKLSYYSEKKESPFVIISKRIVTKNYINIGFFN